MDRDIIELTTHQVRSLIDDCYEEEDGYIEGEDIGFKVVSEST